ncbi:hypothetical protein B0J13DRAFT_634753 [Dactylonectria estremocensis]|uniref:Uncharacterized protein n=1 Tax=Dactylonectria estremocensis TaxID=1079267 RepID=A0A9P9FKC7_9HYPO|nr:hypothetical protein B0J13DRAFT_634753 [Dactylonectria estremocensis]
MRPELVTKWRKGLPPPFDRASATPSTRRRASFVGLRSLLDQEQITTDDSNRGNRLVQSRRRSTDGALEDAVRPIFSTSSVRRDGEAVCAGQVESAVQKLRAWAKSNASAGSTNTTSSGSESFDLNIEELAELAAFCFPEMQDVPVTITEYSRDSCRVSTYALREVLNSPHLLDRPIRDNHVRWIFAEYYKLGTFWGSDQRCFQWGTDPAIFEASPVRLLQERLAKLDRTSGRPSQSANDIEGYKQIGKYHRQEPGCPEYLGLRTSASGWIEEEATSLFITYLEQNPATLSELSSREDNDLRLGLAYIRARSVLMKKAFESKNSYRDVQEMLRQDGDHMLGSWDDHVECLEFHGEHTLLTCGSPRLYKVAAERLARRNDPLRKNPDTALLYYVLARVSIENDEMMQDQPERSLNKLFITLKSKSDISREHVEKLSSLQQVIFDQIEYIEENQRELVIWGIPPFPNHKVHFHHDHSPPASIRRLINQEMRLVNQDFCHTLRYWRALQSKVDRYLDVLIQLRVLDQQDLTVEQSRMAISQQQIALNEARTLRFQSRSVFIFTAITTIFVPLSFFTSYFSMDVASVLASPYNSQYFWMVGGSISGGIVLAVFITVRFISREREPDLEKGADQRGAKFGERFLSWNFISKATKLKLT